MSKRMVIRHSLILGLVLVPVLGIGQLFAQGPMGSGAYQPPPRAGLNSLAMKLTKDRDERAGNAAAALARGLGVAATTNAVGNWQQIDMILGKGAHGTIIIESPQNNTGDETADADATSTTYEIHNEKFGLAAGE